MKDYNDGCWWGWNGGECPVHQKTVVDVRFKDKFITYEVDGFAPHGDTVTVSEGKFEAGYVPYWDEVIAFRVVKEHREPKVWWRVGKHLHETKAEAKQFLSELKRDNPGLSFDEWEVVRVVEAEE